LRSRVRSAWRHARRHRSLAHHDGVVVLAGAGIKLGWAVIETLLVSLRGAKYVFWQALERGVEVSFVLPRPWTVAVL
jgi:hypothetical protein